MRRLVLKLLDNEPSTERTKYAYDYGRIFSPAYQLMFQSFNNGNSFADVCCLSAVDNEDFLPTNKASSWRMLINIQEMRLSCRKIYDVFFVSIFLST